jgi:2-dehydro-3-deoxyphosphogluconate aldolase/(4S)-4-hydroxy-2-oxoglutarate aldolase
VPIIRVSSESDALWVADTCCAAGLDVVEITMTVPGALRAIGQLARKFGDSVIVGAGTVLSREMAVDCINAGARFLISPAVIPEVVDECRSHDVVSIPGALTPTEIHTAWLAGADIVKVFPCSAVGGADYLKIVKGPFPEIKMLPTGGITIETAASYIAAGAVAVGIGADLLDPQAIRDRDPGPIIERAQRLLAAIRQARGGTN